MKQNHNLTSEAFKGLFKSHFDLANHAIQLARFYTAAGKEVTSIDELLDEVRLNPHDSYLEELKKLEEEEAAAAPEEEQPPAGSEQPPA